MIVSLTAMDRNADAITKTVRAKYRIAARNDDAVAQSFFATLKKELVHGCAFETRSEAYDALSDYIENYSNAKGRHSAAGTQQRPSRTA